MVRAQMKIQQMAFMILAVFFFFILVGLFFLGVKSAEIKKDASILQTEQAISSLSVIADMGELNCNSRSEFCLDLDKVKVMSGSLGNNYSNFWPVASIDVYIAYPSSGNVVDCPGPHCNHYKIFDNGQRDTQKYSTFVSICERVSSLSGFTYDDCKIGKLVTGVRIYDKN